MIRTTVIETPVGPLALLEHDGALVASGFTADPTEMHDRLPTALRSYELVQGDLGDLAKAHEAYFAGDLDALDELPVHQVGGWRLERLWAEMRKIRAGETISYAGLAERAEIVRGARVAGAACARNLIAPAVPCHRILATGGGLNGYYYGLDRKDWLLRHESQPNVL